MNYIMMSSEFFLFIWARLISLISREQYTAPYPELRLASVTFREPYLLCVDYDAIALAVMLLLLKCSYHTGASYGKFTVGYIMSPIDEKSKKVNAYQSLSLTIGMSIPLVDQCGNMVPNMDVYAQILKQVKLKAEEYDDFALTGILIRVYLQGDIDSSVEIELPLSYDEIADQILKLMATGPGSDETPDVKATGLGNKKYSNYIKALKPKKNAKRRPFIVADTETVKVNDNHVPYAVGFLVVWPGEDVISMPALRLETYFSEDHIHFLPKFEDRSCRILFLFIERLRVVMKVNKDIRSIYFHNLSRFDGILLMKYLASKGDPYHIKPLLRNNRLYKLSVYEGKKLLFTFKDSYTLLPSSLASLAKTLCPELGSKGSIPHEEIQVSNLIEKSEDLISYMKQDIRLLGGVMLKAQDIYWSLYHVDIETLLTVSALALSIYRTNYYDDESWPFHIPNRNEDNFIRRGYYGGHADAYKPYGENLYYYDVNSLYPYIMKNFPMPGGVPVWHGHLEDRDLADLYGFIEASVVCPSHIDRPFLPYRDNNKTLVFPTGKFVGVYYSEELKYARDLGYNIIPLRGYLFEKKASPFEDFIESVYEKRLEAKKSGDGAMVYVYKILMNSLYGRFGINPESTVTEVCDKVKYDSLILKDNVIFGDKLSDKYYIVSYVSNKANVADSEWNPPRISAVQLSAAITACARIHMYPFISRPDCYYTDTDSVVLGSTLPEDYISSTELGKFKLEHLVNKGYFLAPKAYALDMGHDDPLIKYKGPAKGSVNLEWFVSQYMDPSRIKVVDIESSFHIDWKTLDIGKKESLYRLATPASSKRDPVYDECDTWIDTQPKIVADLGGQDITFIKLELKELREDLAKKEQEHAQKVLELASRLANKEQEHSLKEQELASRLANKELEIARLQLEVARLQSRILSREALPKAPCTESPNVSEQPTLYDKQPRKGRNKGKPDKVRKPKPNKGKRRRDSRVRKAKGKS